MSTGPAETGRYPVKAAHGTMPAPGPIVLAFLDNSVGTHWSISIEAADCGRSPPKTAARWKPSAIGLEGVPRPIGLESVARDCSTGIKLDSPADIGRSDGNIELGPGMKPESHGLSLATCRDREASVLA